MKTISQFSLGDMLLTYMLDNDGHVGMQLLPAEKAAEAIEKRCMIESIVQLHVRCDTLPAAYGNGHTMALTASTARMGFAGQEHHGDSIVTTLRDRAGRIVRHLVMWHPGLKAIQVSAEFENGTNEPLTLELLSSFSLGGLTPFAAGDAPDTLLLHRARSAWSAEGRLVTQSVEELNLEPSWARHGIRVEKFGQVGSMPVRGWFPFAALEDRRARVTWAAQLAIPSSWQVEVRRKDDGLSMAGGLPDYDYGHWAKTVLPGERFRTPQAYLTAGCGGVDAVSQRLQTIHREYWAGKDRILPVVFNEYCATWGNPSQSNLEHITETLKGHDADYLVIDAGWYGTKDAGWSDCGGDWIPNEETMFPKGLKHTADMIRAAGFKPGLWFEPETCARKSAINAREELLLRRHGIVIDTDNRRFLDMRKPEVQAYLRERIIGLLSACGFEYVKIDYNDCIGIGCDGAESLGEGLRQNMEGTLAFFRGMREEIPGLCIENCASGGHRLEPSLMAVSDMASFSDAHECPEIPIIAAGLHRLVLPGQSQIWAVIRETDSLRRINYSLAATFLGVMCRSGEISALTAEQWQKVDEGISFYRAVQHIIRDGVSSFHGQVSASWRNPEGWQAVCRQNEQGETLAVIHTFGGALPAEITLPVKARHILRCMNSEGNTVSLEDGRLTVPLKSSFEAIAVYLA